MRDLAADLELLRDIVSTGETEDIAEFAEERYPGTIRRAVAAEVEVELLRQQLAKVEAGAVLMRHILIRHHSSRMDFYREVSPDFAADLKLALSSTAGVAMLERLRKLEAVAEAAKSIVLPECKRCSSYGPCTKDEEDCGIYKLKCALAALEGGQTND